MRFARSRSALLSAVVAGLAIFAIGCPGRPAVAPTYDGQPGAPIAEKDIPLAVTQYVFAGVDKPDRLGLARPLAERMLLRARDLFASGREETALAAVRLAAMLIRENDVAASSLSDGAVAAFDAAVQGPAARGDEGASIGLYLFWTLARPADPRPKAHLEALAKWTESPQGVPSALVSIGREALRRSDALAYAPTNGDLPAADASIVKWMDQIVAFKEGERTPLRYNDEVYWAVFGFHTSAARLVAGHLRGGDVAAAIEAISAPQTQGFVSDSLRHALLDAGSQPNEAGYEGVLAALMGEAKKGEGLQEPMSDAILGTALTATAAFPHDARIAEVVARGMLMSGAGDAAPAILARAMLGTADDPRRPAAKDLGHALTIGAAALRDYADREEFDAARRTYKATIPLLLAADEVGGVKPSAAQVKTLMALVEGEAGQPNVARSLFDEAIASDPDPVALAGRARLDARDGDLTGARARLAKAVAAKGLQDDLVLGADILTLSGDLARRAGDVQAARTNFEEALRFLAAARTAKNASPADLGRRTARILARFEGAETKEDDAASVAESTSNDPKVVAASVIHRFLRALRAPDPKRARASFRRAMDLGLRGEDLVRAAVLARAIARRANVTVDPDVAKVLTAAATKDDAAGRLAKFALGQLDEKTVVGKAGTARRVLQAQFVIALTRWGEGGLTAAKKDLEVVSKGDIIGSLEIEMALELLEPDKAVIPGTVKGPT